MNPTFMPSAWDDHRWSVQHERKRATRIHQIVQVVLRAPYDGIGKPEPLEGDLSEYWSRRVNDEHRLIYRVTENAVIFIACRYHYGE